MTAAATYEVFSYLVSRDRGTDAAESVEDRYTLAALANRPVVQDEHSGRRYLVFEDRKALWEHIQRLPDNQRCFHEVIFGKQPQRLKFDIDVPAHKLDAISEETLRACLGEEKVVTLASGGAPDPEIESMIDDLIGGSEDEAPPKPLEKGAVDAALKRERDRKMAAILEYLIDKLVDELFMAYYAIEDVTTTRQDIIIAESSGRTDGGWKYSYHIIVAPYAVADNEEAREFTRQFLEGVAAPIRKLVDPQVNKRMQNFRLALNSKLNAFRFKIISAETAGALGTMPATPSETMIVAPPGMRILPRIFTAEENATHPPAKIHGMTEADVRAVLDIAAKRTEGHSVRAVKGSLILFERDAPTYCEICGETHRKDNTLMISVEAIEAAHSEQWPGREPRPHHVIEHCRHSPGKGIVIGEAKLSLGPSRLTIRTTGLGTRAGETDDASSQGRVANRLAGISDGKVNPHDANASLFECIPEIRKTLYDAPTMQAYELVPTLAVKAQMKLGKTRALRAFLDSKFPGAGLHQSVIRFVTFRQTFSNSLKEQFPDFSLYSDQKGDLDHVRFPRLVVQVESLHRLPMPANEEPIDLLILDEVESILSQFNSGLHRHFNATFAMFSWLLKTARHVVCMDANLGDRTYRTLVRMRPDYPIHFHWNRFARAAEDTYYFTDKQAAWLGELHTALRKGKNVVLASNSLAEAKALHEELRRDFPAKKIAIYSSEMAPSEKARHFANVHEYWGRLNVLIYTPTVSAGVSFEIEHYDVLFGYFTDMSCDVETCRQMLGRVRNLRDRKHYICLRGIPNNLPTNIEEIKRLVHDKRAGLYRSVDDTALQFEYALDGEIEYYKSEYFYLWMETIRVENLSKNAFIERFIDQVKDTGAQVEGLADAEPSAAALLVEHKRMKKDIKHARCEAIASSDDITAEEAAAIREDLLKQQQQQSGSDQTDVSDARKFSYEKWQLKDAYAWHGRPANSDFVEKYLDESAKRVYRNLSRITEKETIYESLRSISERESIHYRYMMANRIEGKAYVNEGRDLQKDKRFYVFQSHFIAVWLLRICGFVCITDKSFIHEDVLEWRLRSALPAIEKAAANISFEFSIRKPSLSRLGNESDTRKFLTGMLALVNGVLRIMYGIEMKRTAKRRGGRSFYLNQTETGMLFVFADEPEPDNAPGGPRPHIASQLRPLCHDASIARFIEDEYVERVSADDGSADDALLEEPDDSSMVFEQTANAPPDVATAPPSRERDATAASEEVELFIDAVFDAIGGL